MSLFILTFIDRPQWAVGGALANIQPAIESKYVWECRALGGATYAWFKNGFEMTRGYSIISFYVKFTLDWEKNFIFRHLERL